MTVCTVAGINMVSPVLAASGCAGAGAELARYTDLSGFGAVITRSVTVEPRPGTPHPRLVETPSGLANALGLPGPGVDVFITTEIPALLAAGATVIVSIWAEHAGDYAKVAARLRHVEGVSGIEVNVSHPAATPPDVAGIVHQVRRNSAASVPVFAKLGVENTVALARTSVHAGADGISLINAVPALPIQGRRPALGSIVGGLSGPAITPLALRAVWQVRQALPETPIIGSGGIMTSRDALAFGAAGADVVAVGSALLNDATAGARIASELHGLLDGHDLSAVRTAAAPPPA